MQASQHYLWLGPVVLGVISYPEWQWRLNYGVTKTLGGVALLAMSCGYWTITAGYDRHAE